MARCIMWNGALPTLSAWTFASAGELLTHLRTAWSHRLGDVVMPDGIFRGMRFQRLPCQVPFGVELLSQRDVFLFRPAPRRIARPPLSDTLLFAPEGTLLVGGQGTLGEGEIFGRLVYASGALTTSAVTEHLLRIRVQPEHLAVAYAFLSSGVGFRLLRSTAVGTKLLSMRPDLLRLLPFPDVPAGVAELAGKHLDEAVRARTAGDKAESEALRVIDEEVVPEWLT
jgi:type I restriction enzyme S subunit